MTEKDLIKRKNVKLNIQKIKNKNYTKKMMPY